VSAARETKGSLGYLHTEHQNASPIPNSPFFIIDKICPLGTSLALKIEIYGGEFFWTNQIAILILIFFWNFYFRFPVNAGPNRIKVTQVGRHLINQTCKRFPQGMKKSISKENPITFRFCTVV